MINACKLSGELILFATHGILGCSSTLWVSDRELFSHIYSPTLYTENTKLLCGARLSDTGPSKQTYEFKLKGNCQNVINKVTSIFLHELNSLKVVYGVQLIWIMLLFKALQALKQISFTRQTFLSISCVILVNLLISLISEFKFLFFSSYTISLIYNRTGSSLVNSIVVGGHCLGPALEIQCRLHLSY